MEMPKADPREPMREVQRLADRVCVLILSSERAADVSVLQVAIRSSTTARHQRTFGSSITFNPTSHQGSKYESNTRTFFQLS